jgi:hypothetical protein
MMLKMLSRKFKPKYLEPFNFRICLTISHSLSLVIWHFKNITFVSHDMNRRYLNVSDQFFAC